MKAGVLAMSQKVVGEKVRREKALDFSGCMSRPGTGSLHPVDGMSSTWRPAPQRLMKTGSIGSMLCRGVWSRGLRPYWCLRARGCLHLHWTCDPGRADRVNLPHVLMDVLHPRCCGLDVHKSFGSSRQSDAGVSARVPLHAAKCKQKSRQVVMFFPRRDPE
jgi:hypothetical protein